VINVKTDQTRTMFFSFGNIDILFSTLDFAPKIYGRDAESDYNTILSLQLT